MPLDIDRLLAWQEPPLRQAWRVPDTLRHALALGLGADEHDLPFVQERGLVALPTLATVLAHPFGWLYRVPGSGVTAAMCVHAQQTLHLHAPLPAAGEVVGSLKVTGIDDKGAGKGALVHFRRELHDDAGALLCTLDAAMFCRADGRVRGTWGTVPPPPDPLPARAPDLTFDAPTLPQQALLFRLCGDLNPIHADPECARAAGFERPLLHGLATFGIAAHALVRTAGGGDATRLRRIEARFAQPAFPGETLRTEIWCAADAPLRFRVRVPRRDAVVLDQGLAEFGPALNRKT